MVFFEAANITNQILNFGLPSPIDVQVTGRDAGPNYKIAQQLAEQIARIPGAADVHIHQVVDAPELRINVDRTKAGQLGLTQQNVANSLLISLSGSGQVAPNQWLNWGNGVNYQVLVQTPQYKIDSVEALMRTPISNRNHANGFDYIRLHGRYIGRKRRIHGCGAQPSFGGLWKSGIASWIDAASFEPGYRRSRRGD